MYINEIKNIAKELKENSLFEIAVNSENIKEMIEALENLRDTADETQLMVRRIRRMREEKADQQKNNSIS